MRKTKTITICYLITDEMKFLKAYQNYVEMEFYLKQKPKYQDEFFDTIIHNESISTDALKNNYGITKKIQ